MFDKSGQTDLEKINAISTLWKIKPKQLSM